MKVKDIMNKTIINVSENATIYDAAKLMSLNNIGFLPVTNIKDEIIGVITDRDIITRALSQNLNSNTLIKNIMTKKVVSISKNDDISFAISKMADNQIRRIVVLEKKNIIGIITIKDLTKSKETLIYLPDLFKEILYNYDKSLTLFKEFTIPLEI